MIRPRSVRCVAPFLLPFCLAVATGCSDTDSPSVQGDAVDKPPATLPTKADGRKTFGKAESKQETVESNQLSAKRVRVIAVPNGGSVPDAEIDEEGVVHLAYLATDNVYYVKSSDGGRSFSEPIRVNSEAGFAAGKAHRGPDLAVGKNGRIHVVWYNGGYQRKRPKDQWGVMYSHIDSDKTPFEPTRNLNRKPSDNFSLAADNSGRVAAIWMAGGVYVNLSSDGGNHFAPPADLEADPCECCGSRAIYAADGNLSVFYRDKADDYRDSYIAFLPRGELEFTHVKTSQAPWYITSCPMTGSFLSADGKGLIASWETKQKIYYARLDDRGKRLSSGEILVADRGRYPVALRAADGTTLVAWKNGERIEWQLFDAQDEPKGKRDSTDCANRDRPSGVVTKDGQFLLFP